MLQRRMVVPVAQRVDLHAALRQARYSGSGTVLAKGTVERLQMTVGGSGKAEMAGLKVDKAEINVGGSGDAQFASDGEVEANIAGSGDITVTGTAASQVGGTSRFGACARSSSERKRTRARRNSGRASQFLGGSNSTRPSAAA